MLRSHDLSQPEVHRIFAELNDRAGFGDYVFSAITTILGKHELSKTLATKARQLHARAKETESELNATLLVCYLRIAKPLSQVPTFKSRRAVSLQELSKQLFDASQALSHILHNVNAVARLSPVPVGMAELEKARQDLRHNRAEIAIAAASLPPPGKVSGDLETNTLVVSAHAAITSIANTIDTLEVTYAEMEAAITGNAKPSPAVH